MKHFLRHGIVFVLYGLIVCFLLFPFPAHISTHLLDAASGDPLLQVWVTQWTIHKLTTSIAQYFDANIFHPYSNTFAFHDHMAGLGVLGLPIQLTGHNPILTFNLLLLLSFIFSAFSMYLFAHDLCKRRFAAFVAGTIFGFLPYRMAHLDHLNLLSIYWLPLIFLCLTRLILARAATLRPQKTLIALFWICYLLQALTSFNYLFMTTIVIVIYGLSLIAWEWEFDAVIFQRALRRDLLPFVLGGCLAMAALLPFALPYLKANRDMGFERTNEEIIGLSAASLNYLAAPENNLLYGKVTTHFRSASSPYPKEQMLFFGLIPLLLAALTIPFCWKKRTAYNAPRQGIIRSIWLLMGCAFIMSLGPSVVLFGRTVALPYAYLYDYLPGFKSMRVPARFGLIVAFCIAILAAYAIARLEQYIQLRYRRGFAVLCGTGVLVALLLEYWPSHLELTPYPGTIERIPPVYAWLRQQPNDLRLIELPMNFPKDQFESLYYSTFHWKQMVNGRSAFIPSGISQLFDEMRQFPSPRALALLQSLKIDTIVVHTDRLERPFPDALPEKMRLIQQFGTDKVFHLASAETASPHWSVAYRLPLTLQANETYRVGAVLTPANPQPMSPLPQERTNVEIVWKAHGQVVQQEQRHLLLPILFESGKSEMLPLSLTTPAMPEQYEVSLRIEDRRFEPASFTKQITLVQDIPDSRRPQKLQVELLRVEHPPIWPAGKPLALKIAVKNSGDTLWRSLLPDRQKPVGEVHFAVRDWHDATSGESISQAANIRLETRDMLPYDVAPGDEVVLAISIPTPPMPGSYRVECDFVSEHMQWFGHSCSFDVTLE